MNRYIVKVLHTEYLTHNVKRFVVEKPANYTFVSGQATEVSINTPELKNELRPFTFTSLAGDDYLEFIIKIYTGHGGITEKMALIKADDELIVHDVFGSIAYQGAGIFIAAGAGITPFISIFRDLKGNNNLAGNTLLFANRTAGDVILESELEALLGANFINVIQMPFSANDSEKFITQKLLAEHLTSASQFFYICGPDKFNNAVTGYLKNLGISETQIVLEQ